MLDPSYDELYPNSFTFIVENASDLEDFSGIEISPQSKNKINNRVFDLYSLEDNVRLGANTLIESIMNGSMVFQTEYQEQRTSPRISIIPDDDEERPLKVVKMISEEICQICLDEASTIMLGCGHKAMCDNCANRCLAEKNACPICRGKVEVIYKDI